MVGLSFMRAFDMKFTKDKNKHIRFSSYDADDKIDLQDICQLLESQMVVKISIMKAPVRGCLSLWNIFHEYIVLETRDCQSGDTSFWSIEKHCTGFEIQNSTEIADVVDKINYKDRSFSFSWPPQMIEQFEFVNSIATDALCHFLREWTKAEFSTDNTVQHFSSQL